MRLNLKKLFLSIQKLKNGGRFERAIKLLEDAHRVQPTNLEIGKKLAELYTEVGEERQAVDILSQFLRTQPENSIQIFEIASQLLHKVPNSLFLRELMFRLRITHHELEEAEKIASSLKDSELAVWETRYTNMLQAHLDYGEKADSETLLLYYSLALLSKIQNKYSAAAKFLLEIVKAFPQERTFVLAQLENLATKAPRDVSLQFSLAEGYILSEEIDQGVKKYIEIAISTPEALDKIEKKVKELTHHQPSNLKVKQAFGDICILKGKATEALLQFEELQKASPEVMPQLIPRYQKILELEPTNVKARKLLIESYLERGEVDKAIDNLEYILENSLPEYPLIESLRNLITTAPDNQKARLLLSKAYVKENRYPEALLEVQKLFQIPEITSEVLGEIVTLLKMILKEAPETTQAYSLLSGIYIKQFQFQEALSLIKETEPKSGEIEENIKHLRKIIEIESENIEALFLLAKFLINTHQYSEAFEYYQKILALAPQAQEKITQELEKALRETHSARAPIIAFYETFPLSEKFLQFKLALAQAYIYDNQVEKAAHQYEAILKFAPEKKEAVIDGYKRIIKKAPNNSSFRFTLASLYGESQEFELATHQLEALIKIDQKHVAEVIKWYQNYIKKFPQKLFLYQALLKIYYQNRYSERLLSAANYIIKNFPPSEVGFAYLILANFYADEGQFTQATLQLNKALENNAVEPPAIITICERILRRDPSQLATYYVLARAYYRSGNLEKAFSAFEEVIKRDQGKLEIIISHCRKIVSEFPNNPRGHYQLGFFYFLKKDFETALKELEKAQTFAPEEYLEQVLALYQMIVKEEPTNAKALFLLGSTLAQKGEYHLAVETFNNKFLQLDASFTQRLIHQFREIIEKAPHPQEALLSLATLYEKEKQFDEAVKIYDRLLNLGSKNQEEVILRCQKILEKTPHHILSYYVLSKAYFLKKEFDTAVQYLIELVKFAPLESPEVERRCKEILSVSPSHYLTLQALGKIYTEQAKFWEATQIYLKVSKYYPEKLPEVIQTLEHLTSLKPDSVFIYFWLGELYLHQPELRKAKEYFLKAEEVAPAENWLVKIYLRLIEINLKEDKLKEAEKFTAKLFELKEAEKQLYREVRALYHQRLTERITEVKRKISQSGGGATSIFELSEYLFEKEEFKEALEILSQLPMQERDVVLQRAILLGRYFIQLGEYLRAVEVLRECGVRGIPLTSLEQELLYWLGVAYEKAGAFAQAGRCFQKLMGYKDARERLTKVSFKHALHQPPLLEC